MGGKATFSEHPLCALLGGEKPTEPQSEDAKGGHRALGKNLSASSEGHPPYPMHCLAEETPLCPSQTSQALSLHLLDHSQPSLKGPFPLS